MTDRFPPNPGRPHRFIGHNPAGDAMGVVLLALTLVTGLTGWRSTTDAFFGDDLVSGLNGLPAPLMMICVGLHLLGVLAASLSHKDNMIKAMITGRKRRIE